jgi:hypothetical protein
MDNARSSYGSCELKSGIYTEATGVIKNIEFRELSGMEEDVLASNKMSLSEKLTRVMSNCTIKIGTIEDRKTINEMIPKIMMADRWYYLVQLRILSVGAAYSFKAKCPSCEHVDAVDYDLNQMKVESSADISNPYREIKLPSGKVVRYRLADGTVDAKIESSSNDQNSATAGLYARIDTIDGQPVGIDKVKALVLKDRAALRADIDKNEGSIDDVVKFVCPECGHKYEGNLPLEGRSFFYPAE